MKYKPDPIDVSGTILPRNFNRLARELARNLHEQWAAFRMRDGWSYSINRSEKEKVHPSLRPFGSLPEKERKFNIAIARETLKAVFALGYKIDRNSEESGLAKLYGKRLNSSELFKQLDKMDLSSLLATWNLMSARQQKYPAALFESLGKSILRKGEALMAYDILSAGAARWPESKRLARYLALALAESGSTERANKMICRLYKTGSKDSETAGILARTFKDLAWLYGEDRYMNKAHEIYHQSYRRALAQKKAGWLDMAVYTGINAATTALLAGKHGKAVRLAIEVRKFCLNKLKISEDYWALATLGESEAILQNWAEAERWYSKAVSHANNNYRLITSTSRQAKIILRHFGRNDRLFNHCFGMPRVVVFSGHMIDQPGRKTPRFPAQIENDVRREISARLDNLDAGIGFSSAACGSDIIFLEEMLKRKQKYSGKREIESNIILPFPESDFRRSSVDIIPRSGWKARYESALKHATKVIVASDRRTTGTGIAYEFCNMLLDGLAILRAKALDTDYIPLVVWDGKAGDGEGGTYSLVKHWRTYGVQPEVIELPKLLQGRAIINPSHERHVAHRPVRPADEPASADFKEEIRAMLFGDVVSYSKLLEEQVPLFIKHFMSLVSALAGKYKSEILFQNTWGDALYFVFKSVRGAGLFSLELSSRIGSMDWQGISLPENLNIRLALHAGPVIRCVDPVIDQTVFTGTHVSRAARIEQITPPGNVYASDEFAALCTSGRVTDFRLDYVGKINLPKKYGTYPLYHVTARHGDGGKRQEPDQTARENIPANGKS